MTICKAKQELRNAMASQKKKYSSNWLSECSVEVLNRLEKTDLFQKASCIAMYHALPDEVNTAKFIEKWSDQKRILLPVVVGEDLYLQAYKGNRYLKKGPFGILEPASIEEENNSLFLEEELDLLIIPGVAFDKKGHRLGRGKGYYDRLLSTIFAPKVGICFEFQLFDNIPIEPFDIPMDIIITEKETLFF